MTDLSQRFLHRVRRGKLGLVFRQPLQALADCRRIGRPSRYLAFVTGDARMRYAAARMTPLTVSAAPDHWPACRFLTGKNHWQQTVFCARSFELALGVRPRFGFFDDGSFDDGIAALLTGIFPGSRVYRTGESDECVEAMLPAKHYPALHSVRRHCKYHRKLFDLRSHGGGWNLFLDSDMLFHAAPDEIVAWMNAPARSLYLHDRIEGIFTGPEHFEHLAEGPFVRHLNSGLLTIDDRSIDWDHLEWFASRCDSDHHANRTFEQNLTALHMARVKSDRLDPDRYRVIYDAFETAPPAVLLHYCWHSNPCYRAGEWQRFRQCAG